MSLAFDVGDPSELLASWPQLANERVGGARAYINADVCPLDIRDGHASIHAQYSKHGLSCYSNQLKMSTELLQSFSSDDDVDSKPNTSECSDKGLALDRNVLQGMYNLKYYQLCETHICLALPPRTEVLSITPSGASDWVETMCIKCRLEDGTTKGFFMKVCAR